MMTACYQILTTGNRQLKTTRMADYTLRKNAMFSARGIARNILLPAVIGVIVTMFFFQYVPTLMGLLYDKQVWGKAFARGFWQVIELYQGVFEGTKDANIGMFAWPILGAVGGVYLNRLYGSD
jgi:hypothetical protein